MSTHAQPTPSTDAESTTKSGSNDHVLDRIAIWPDITPGGDPDQVPSSPRMVFWRCRNCGQERSQPSAFRAPCAHPDPETPLQATGYSIDDARTRRALTEAMTVRFIERGPVYHLDSASGNTYEVDVAARTCSCPDHRKRDPADGCKHLRRVDLEIRAGLVPRPDGVFN